MPYVQWVASPVGRLLLASDEECLLGLWIEGQKYFEDTLSGQPLTQQETPVLRRAADWIARYFAGDQPRAAELPLRPAGSAFRQEVWRLLCEIPYGEVTTYGTLARELARRHRRDSLSAQAVGGAVGHNPISLTIPCHRVIGAAGSLTGYAGGIEKKRWLLQWEGVDVSRLSVPTKGTAL